MHLTDEMVPHQVHSTSAMMLQRGHCIKMGTGGQGDMVRAYLIIAYFFQTPLKLHTRQHLFITHPILGIGPNQVDPTLAMMFQRG
jgi:hypothetical protein